TTSHIFILRGFGRSVPHIRPKPPQPAGERHMRVWMISSFGIDSLEFAERPDTKAGPGEALIKVHAVSLNYRDLLMVKGLYNPKLKLPRIPCSDGAGEVVAG